MDWRMNDLFPGTALSSTELSLLRQRIEDLLQGEAERAERDERAECIQIARAHQHIIGPFDPPDQIRLATYSNGTCELIARAIRARESQPVAPATEEKCWAAYRYDSGSVNGGYRIERCGLPKGHAQVAHEVIGPDGFFFGGNAEPVAPAETPGWIEKAAVEIKAAYERHSYTDIADIREILERHVPGAAPLSPSPPTETPEPWTMCPRHGLYCDRETPDVINSSAVCKRPAPREKERE